MWIDIGYEGARGDGEIRGGGMLRISVTDDGRGGADPGHGTGLLGTERRIAALRGPRASSPLVGPTVVNMEIPCVLSSPKTSSC